MSEKTGEFGQPNFPDSVNRILNLPNKVGSDELTTIRKEAERDVSHLRLVDQDKEVLEDLAENLQKRLKTLTPGGDKELYNEILLVLSCTGTKRANEIVKNQPFCIWEEAWERVTGKYVPKGFDFSRLPPAGDEEKLTRLLQNTNVSEDEISKWINASRFYAKYDSKSRDESQGDCYVVSNEFRQFCSKYFGLESQLGGYPSFTGEMVHWVNIIKGKVEIDWTAWQFKIYEDQPRPRVAKKGHDVHIY